MTQDAYREAGVDIDAAHDAVHRYQELLADCADPRVMRGIGGFSGCFSFAGYTEPVLVASTDGIGTKVIVAATLGRYDGVGADLVNHCINDVLCANAQPLFFLDYLAMGKLEPQVAAAIVASVAAACRRNGLALLGGETAEMPGVYAPPHFDLAGTVVGAVERSAMIDLAAVTAQDAVIGLPANGLHTNGYSLARRVLPASSWSNPLPGGGGLSIGDALLAVHPCYLPVVRDVQRAGIAIKSMAHVTGGGLSDNLPRALPDHLAARLNPASWRVPPIVELVAREAGLSHDEAYRTFNMGVGFCLVVAPHDAHAAKTAASASLARNGVASAGAEVIGAVQPAQPSGPRVIFNHAA